MHVPRVLLAGEHAQYVTLDTLLLGHGCATQAARDHAGLARSLEAFAPSVVVVAAMSEAPRDELDVVGTVRRRDAAVGIVLLVEKSSEERAIAALRARVDEYLRPPVSAGEVVATITRLLGRVPRPDAPRGRDGAGARAAETCAMVGDSEAMRGVRAYLARVAPTDTNVLITGETGTGKELVARLIHLHSRRARRAFVPINCAALPEGLLESELFGHERGAFTGAHTTRPGALLAADGGTVFFDEIGDMSPHGQAKILRAIETKEVRRVGGRDDVALDVRVIAATNQDLERAVAERTFRGDLYFRLNVARIHIPPLRERKEDLPRLLDHYRHELNRQFDRDVEGFTDEVTAWLVSYDWPGNIRELKNVLEASFVNARARLIADIDLPERFRAVYRAAAGPPVDERSRLLSALSASDWNKSRAAKRLQWSRMTIYRKIAKYQLTQSRPRRLDRTTSAAGPEDGRQA